MSGLGELSGRVVSVVLLVSVAYTGRPLLLHGQQHSASSSVMSQGGAGRQGAAQYRSGLPGEGRGYPLVPGTGLNLLLLGTLSRGPGHP